MFEVWLILLLTALALGLPGLILVLKNMAMTADALSHTILLGIVLAYFVTKDLNSPFLIVSAAFFGLLTIAVIERLSRHKGLREDAATGLVFPLFFSLAVLLISRFGKGRIWISTMSSWARWFSPPLTAWSSSDSACPRRR